MPIFLGECTRVHGREKDRKFHTPKAVIGYQNREVPKRGCANISASGDFNPYKPAEKQEKGKKDDYSYNHPFYP